MSRIVILKLVIAVAVPTLATADDRPNVILFIADDVSWNDYGCYGNEAARTPTIDRLAANGRQFNNAYLTASSCSPSRSSIVTGRYPHNNGKGAELHKPISAHIPWFPEILREAGYYTALSGKRHITTDGAEDRPKPFDHVDGGKTKGNAGGHANWVKVTKERPKDQPFFFWFAAYDAHRGWDADKDWDADAYGPMHQPADARVPPFLSDDPETRQDLASYENEVTRFDHFIGRVVDELKSQGELDNTLLFVLADNGRPFPRAKTRLHDSGMKTALVAHWPNGIATNGQTDSLASVIDLAPTILDVAGCDVAETMQGLSLGPVLNDAQASVRQLAFSEHNWHDYEAHGRSVRDGEWLYVRNFRPALPWQGPADSVRSPSHQQLLALEAANGLSAAQKDVLLAPRPTEEFYNVVDDPHQLHNLLTGDSSEAAKKQASLFRNRLTTWMDVTGDSVPSNLSPDTFDRRTGESLRSQGKKKSVIDAEKLASTTPGEDRGADRINAPGPR